MEKREREKEGGRGRGRRRERENNTYPNDLSVLPGKSVGMVKSPVHTAVTFRFSVTTITDKIMFQA